MHKYLLIFGAGASYGSDYSGTPPLRNELLGELIRFNPDYWGKIPPEELKLIKKDFEEGIKQLSRRYSTSMAPLQRAMAAYFFGFKPSKSNIYYQLAKRIKEKNWHGSIVTFNYERLLEFCLSDFGFGLIVGQESKSQTDIEICIPHGCCNIFCSVTGRGVSFTHNIRTNGIIQEINEPDKYYKRIQKDAFPPVMSYFEPSKKTTSGAKFIDEQRKRYTQLVTEVSTIGIVGLKVRIWDEHIWKPLAQTSAKIVYCSGKSSGQEYKTWADKNRSGHKDIILSYYFREGFEELCSAIGLI